MCCTESVIDNEMSKMHACRLTDFQLISEQGDKQALESADLASKQTFITGNFCKLNVSFVAIRAAFVELACGTMAFSLFTICQVSYTLVLAL